MSLFSIKKQAYIKEKWPVNKTGQRSPNARNRIRPSKTGQDIFSALFNATRTIHNIVAVTFSIFELFYKWKILRVQTQFNSIPCV
jgi:hypothetical protein